MFGICYTVFKRLSSYISHIQKRRIPISDHSRNIREPCWHDSRVWFSIATIYLVLSDTLQQSASSFY
ncbi:hypothetical protein TSUD_118750 [Trifolium subterraneum]|uniref:Uncharacterized protein n=1 Tax=Trifolium subterraneum TaxID=3900 RepID=A0A2Z6M9N2_TRISU|nr:hypothetical protein TSUD_118750 [Trifolium subterraneum]